MGGKPVILGGDSAMRIVVLEGSPNKKGSSNFLADEFIRGAWREEYRKYIEAAKGN